jgi:hypothetical protein
VNTHLELSHFTAAVLFALFASIVFGITQKEGVREQFRYGLKSFVWFVTGVIVGGWLLWILKH